MPPKPGYVHELTTNVSLLNEQIANHRRETAMLGQEIDRLKAEVAGLRSDIVTEHQVHEQKVAELRQELAILKQRFEDHLRRVETWGQRIWGFVPLLIGALLSLSAGLIVTLARK